MHIPHCTVMCCVVSRMSVARPSSMATSVGIARLDVPSPHTPVGVRPQLTDTARVRLQASQGHSQESVSCMEHAHLPPNVQRFGEALETREPRPQEQEQIQ